jgi:3-deoxy-D-manno-octulosonic-acid transferase
MATRGGQNPIEPAKLGIPIIHGPHVRNFRDVYDALAGANAAVTASDAATLAAAVKRLIEMPGERERLSREAQVCVAKFGGSLDRTIAALEPYLEPLSVRA